MRQMFEDVVIMSVCFGTAFSAYRGWKHIKNRHRSNERGSLGVFTTFMFQSNPLIIQRLCVETFYSIIPWSESLTLVIALKWGLLIWLWYSWVFQACGPGT